MFGIPIAELISLAVRYGPQAIALLEALIPILEKLAPIVEAQMKEGKTPQQIGQHIADKYLISPASGDFGANA